MKVLDYINLILDVLEISIIYVKNNSKTTKK